MSHQLVYRIDDVECTDDFLEEIKEYYIPKKLMILRVILWLDIMTKGYSKSLLRQANLSLMLPKNMMLSKRAATIK